MQWYEVLKIARKVKGYSLRQLENETNISNAYLSQLENGKIKEPGFFIMAKLLTLYNMNICDMNKYCYHKVVENGKCQDCGNLLATK
jgi:transcriptional regulator with XRE-family HTH domain